MNKHKMVYVVELPKNVGLPIGATSAYSFKQAVTQYIFANSSSREIALARICAAGREGSLENYAFLIPEVISDDGEPLEERIKNDMTSVALAEVLMQRKGLSKMSALWLARDLISFRQPQMRLVA